jgi:hypothetical protein
LCEIVGKIIDTVTLLCYNEFGEFMNVIEKKMNWRNICLK